MTKPLSRHAIAFAGYLILALLFTFPLALRMQDAVIGPSPQDSFEYVWKLKWVSDALLVNHVSPLFVPTVYYPHGYPLALGEITPANTYLMSPLTQWVGPVAAYNLLLIASTVLTGWAAFALAWRWYGEIDNQESWLRFAAAFFAGCALTFGSYRFQRLEGQLPLVNVYWVVAALYFADRWVQQPMTRQAILLAIGVALSALSSWYYGYILGLLLPIYILARSGGGRELLEILKRRQSWLGIVLAGLIVAALCVPFLLPQLEIARTWDTKVAIGQVSFWSLSPLDYLLPNARNPLFRNLTNRLIWPFPFPGDAPAEFIVSLDAVTLLLLLLAWHRLKGQRWYALKWLVGIAFVLSLGPYLNLSRLSTAIPLPGLLVRQLLPFADGLRSWGRFAVLVALGGTILAGGGLLLFFAQYSARVRRVGVSICLLLSLALLWDGPLPLVEVKPRAVDEWLATQADNAPIMQYPIAEALSGPTLLYTLYHHKPIVSGYGTYLPLQFRKLHPELDTFPADAALDQLKEWGVRWVLVSLDKLAGEPFSAADLDTQVRLTKVVILDNVAVYQIDH